MMNLLMGYALGNHMIVHRRFAAASGMVPHIGIHCPHNYAKVSELGTVTHRKGAIDASAGVLGIIPGSCGTPSYTVRGKGCDATLNSASHGAGRPRSRSKSKQLFDLELFASQMKGITHYGVASDESPQAYKDIYCVITAQGSQIEVVDVMYPRVVVMGGMTPTDDGD